MNYYSFIGVDGSELTRAYTIVGALEAIAALRENDLTISRIENQAGETWTPTEFQDEFFF